MLEHPLFGSTRTPQNVLPFEVGEAAGRSRLNGSQRRPKSLPQEEEGGSQQACLAGQGYLSELAMGRR